MFARSCGSNSTQVSAASSSEIPDKFALNFQTDRPFTDLRSTLGTVLLAFHRSTFDRLHDSDILVTLKKRLNSPHEAKPMGEENGDSKIHVLMGNLSGVLAEFLERSLRQQPDIQIVGCVQGHVELLLAAAAQT